MRASVSVVLILLLAGGLPAASVPAGSSRAIDDAVAAMPGYDAPHVSPRCDDPEFLRRVMLDLNGYPPNAEQAAAFLADKAADKRTAKIDELLAAPRFAEYWSRRYAEVFFGNYHNPTFDLPAGLTIETRRRLLRSFMAWFAEQIRVDRPWKDVVTAMLTARGNTSTVPELGWKLSFYGGDWQQMNFADGVTRHLLGTNLRCARCHDHPHDRWRIEDYQGFAAFNTRQKAVRVMLQGTEQVEVSYEATGDWEVPQDNKQVETVFRRPIRYDPIYFSENAPKDGDLTLTLVQFMSKDRRLSQALANRVWFWLLGRGVIEPLGEQDMKHLPVSQPLMDALIDAVEEGKGSLRQLVRTICLTEAYQRASESAGKCGKRHFCRAEIQPLTGEQLINSVQVALRGAPGLNLEEAMELTAELSSRPVAGCEVQPLPCSTLHALMFRNSERLWGWIHESPVLKDARKGAPSDGEVTERLFLAILSRTPSVSEQTRFKAFLRDRGPNGLWDASWTLFNTAEFLTRH